MEHATEIDGSIADLNYTRFVGYSQNNECIKKLFSLKHSQ